MINKRRLLALENLMKEEQYKQIARCINNAGRQICELKGYHEIYNQAIGLEFQQYDYTHSSEIDQNKNRYLIQTPVKPLHLQLQISESSQNLQKIFQQQNPQTVL